MRVCRLFLWRVPPAPLKCGYPFRTTTGVTSCSKVTSLRSPYDFIRAQILHALLTDEFVALSAKVIDLGLHASEQSFGRQRVYPCPLKGLNVLALARNLIAPIFDFGPGIFELHGIVSD